ncbi:benzoate 4-monooxygenase cytochrome P450 [Immersiella caudata]|uniref:Benzoate 4-monooxygenase cytochrome P450 n=1 Tax=Immersiella caudata TaxID=314043 RepID=A0AA39WSW9_9PEZI|nr:benzoate 4-monooxygenase cytochrome P450 [Immersiella caudata]
MAAPVESITASISNTIATYPITTLLLALLTYYFAQSLQSYLHLSHIPGPWFAPFTDVFLIYKTWRGETFRELNTLCEKYGPIFRIAPNFVVVGDPAEVKKVWGVRSTFDRARWYKGFRLDPPNDTLISMCDGDGGVHAERRGMVLPGYTGREVAGLHEAVDEGILRFAKLMDEKYISTDTEYRPVDLARKIQFMTLDIAGRIAFGERLGFLDQDNDKWNYIEQAEASLPVMQVIAMRPWIIGLLQSRFLRKMVMPSANDPVGLGKVIGIAKAFVAKRFGPDKIEAPDMLGSFIKHGLDKDTAEAEAVLQVISSSDTTACTIRTALLHILTSPSLYASLLHEITVAISSGAVSSPVITSSEASSLPILQATLKESLRIWPPIHGIMPRVSRSDAVICGKHVPAGTNVCWSSYACLRNKEVFGPDAEVFRLGRWFANSDDTKDKERVKKMDEMWELVFGVGRWSCLGRGIAMVEMGKVVFEILKRWEFTIVDAERPIHNYFTGMLVQSGMWVRVEKRDQIRG